MYYYNSKTKPIILNPSDEGKQTVHEWFVRQSTAWIISFRRSSQTDADVVAQRNDPGQPGGLGQGDEHDGKPIDRRERSSLPQGNPSGVSRHVWREGRPRRQRSPDHCFP